MPTSAASPPACCSRSCTRRCSTGGSSGTARPVYAARMSPGFPRCSREASSCGRIDERLLGYDLERLARAIDPTADLDLELLGVQTLYDRYLLVDKSGASPERIETPQLFWLRVAMGVCLGETGDREARVLELYEVYRQRRFCSSTPTLFNAGTRHPQLSSCYLYVVDDSLESIMQRGIAENAMCSKWAGGLGGSWTAVRGTGSHIGGTNGESQGVAAVPQAAQRSAGRGQPGRQARGLGVRVPRDLAQRHPRLPRAAARDGRRAPPHPRHEHGLLDPRPLHAAGRGPRALDALPQLRGGRAARSLRRGVRGALPRARAARSGGRRSGASASRPSSCGSRCCACSSRRAIPGSRSRIPCNVRSPQDHAGVVHSSNLCTEITLNTSEDETAVCNLGSIVLDQHLTRRGRDRP